MNARLHLKHEIGLQMEVDVHANDPAGLEAEALKLAREFGALGWSAIQVPPGGLRLPYEAEAAFDWSLLGAQRGTRARSDRGREITEHGVWYRGDFYTRRELKAEDEDDEPAVKYSRGARASDPPEVRETSKKIDYVPLALFRGRRPVSEALAAPAPPAVPEPEPVAPVMSDALARLEDTEESRQEVVSYIRAASRRLGPDAALRIDGAESPLERLVQHRWQEILTDFTYRRKVAAGLEQAIGLAYPRLPAETNS